MSTRYETLLVDSSSQPEVACLKKHAGDGPKVVPIELHSPLLLFEISNLRLTTQLSRPMERLLGQKFQALLKRPMRQSFQTLPMTDPLYHGPSHGFSSNVPLQPTFNRIRKTAVEGQPIGANWKRLFPACG